MHLPHALVVYLSLLIALCPVGLEGDQQAAPTAPAAAAVPEDSSPEQQQQCSTCEIRQHIKTMRLNAIKSQILSKLRLKQAPNISRDVVKQLLPRAPPLQELLDQYDVLGDDSRDGLIGEDDDDEHAVTETVMLMATEPPTAPAAAAVPEDSSPEQQQQCSTCEIRQHIKTMRLNAIKSQILSKLRLKQAPNISRDVVKQLLPRAPPLQELLDQYDVLGDDSRDGLTGEDDDDEHAVTETVMLMATEPDPVVQVNHTPRCCFFSFSQRMQANRIVRAQLWVHLRAAEEATTVFLQISRLMPATDGSRHIGIRSLKIDVNAGVSSWKSIDVKQVLSVWLRQPETNWGIEINAYDSRGNDLVATSLEPGEEGLANRIVRAQLWVHLRAAEEATTVFLQISRLMPATDGSRHIGIRSLKIDVNAGVSSWKSIDVKQVLSVWLRQPETNWGIEINAYDSRGNDLVATSLEPGEEGLTMHLPHALVVYLSLLIALCPVGLEGDQQAAPTAPAAAAVPEDSSPEQQQQQQQCSTCEIRQHIKTMRLNAIKSQILSKLRLKQAPNISRDVVKQLLPRAPPLQELLDQYDVLGDDSRDGLTGEDDDDEHAVTETVMLMATEPDPVVQVNRAPRCCFFSFSQRLQANRIVRAQLWVHLRAAEEATTVFLQISRLMPATDGSRHIGIRSLKIDVNAGVSSWKSIDVKQVLSVWLRQPETNWGIEINAYDSRGNDLVATSLEPGEAGLQPFMEVKVSEGPKRTRRDSGLDCDENSPESRCCRYPLTVDFEDFGWDWVIAPKRYKANYCSGECEYMYLQKYPHTHLVHKASPRGNAGPCCTPTKMSPINMLYFNRKEQIIYGKLPSMVVDRCGCS
ncbi:hypothetical protein CRUP_032739 [Coryphaenoides rupestris]|nr:hypothetical protein CRUP_032739 [Coryphaenoides rupestris]